MYLAGSVVNGEFHTNRLYLAGQFPAYAGLAASAVRWRRGESVTFTAADALATADSIDAVVADPWAG